MDAKTQMYAIPRLDSTSLIPLQRNGTERPEQDARLQNARETANSFEAIFIRQLFGIMRSSIGGDGMFGEGTVGEIYGDIVDNALAETLSERSFLGISDLMYNRIIRDIVPGDEGGEATTLRSRNE